MVRNPELENSSCWFSHNDKHAHFARLACRVRERLAKGQGEDGAMVQAAHVIAVYPSLMLMPPRKALFQWTKTFT